MKPFRKILFNLFRLLSILVIASISLTSCGFRIKTTKYDIGDFATQIMGESIITAATSDKNIFDINDVTFNFHFSIGEEIEFHSYTFTGYDEVFFAIYICEANEKRDSDYIYDCFDKEGFISDYKNVKNHHFVREISEAEIVSGNYSHEVKFNRFYYNHSEPITIPCEIFSKNAWEFSIIVQPYNVDYEKNSYRATFHGTLTFNYEKLDNGKIKIEFNENKIYFEGE